MSPLPLFELLLALVFALWIRRRPPIAAAPGYDSRPPTSRLEWGAAAVALLLTSAPLLVSLPLYLGPEANLPSDASSHAVVAKAIAAGGLFHGWVDRYNGGFPLFLHYQPLVLLVLSALIRLGIDPVSATQGVGLFAVIVTPFVALVAWRRAGADPLGAFVGAALLALLIAEHPLDGGTETYLSQGLLSQAAFMPLALAWVALVIKDRPRGAYVLLAALLPLAHTQISVALFAVAVPLALLTASKEPRTRVLLSACVATISAITAYGAGLSRFVVPLGVPDTADWQRVGFPPSHLADYWLEGALLDWGRAPVLTSLTRWSFVVLLGFAVRSRTARAAALALAAATLLSVAGTTLDSLGRRGVQLQTIFSPQRATSLVPFAASAVVALGVSFALSSARARVEPRHLRRVTLAASLCAFAILAGAFVSKAHALLVRASIERDWTGENECGPESPPGFSSARVRAWVASVERGRLAIDSVSFRDQCPVHRGIEVASSVPLGATVGGPGSQVGLLNLAFERFTEGPPEHPERDDGLQERAEALGVRYLLRRAPGSTPPPSGFRVREEGGQVQLLERSSGGNLFGLACIRTRWTGSNAALRAALIADLDGEMRSLAPSRGLISLEEAESDLRSVPFDDGSAEPCSAEGAVKELPAAVGRYAAEIAAEGRSYAVLRVAAIPGLFSFFVDDRAVAALRVAPGFFAVPVPKGDHVVRAVVEWPVGYREGGAATALLVASIFAYARRRRAIPPSPHREGGGALEGSSPP